MDKIKYAVVYGYVDAGNELECRTIAINTSGMKGVDFGLILSDTECARGVLSDEDGTPIIVDDPYGEWIIDRDETGVIPLYFDHANDIPEFLRPCITSGGNIFICWDWNDGPFILVDGEKVPIGEDYFADEEEV